MADHGTTVRGIDYKATFPFVHLFKGFRLAIDPSKIVLALALLTLVYAGGRLLDAVWPERHRAVQDELAMYVVEPVDFAHARAERLAARDAGLRAQLNVLGHPNDPADHGHYVSALRERRDETIRTADRQYLESPQKTDDAKRVHDETVRDAHANYAFSLQAARAYKTDGLFIHLLMYEVHQVDGIVWDAVNLRVEGVVGGLSNFFITAPAWAFRYHPLYFTIFFTWALILWSIFGGAISRVAAVQVARDEKISVRQALRFSTGKVLSFIFAPLIPVIIVAVLGLILAVAACLISVPGLGGIWSILVGIVFFLALLAGLVMMLTAVGLIGGGHLMYPTIAAEGSDSFDAVSRSFSYLYARPWQLGFYSFVSLVYGAITYLFVRLALYVLLLLVHGSISLLQWGHAADGTPIFDAMWPRPTNFMNLSYDTNYAVLGPVQAIGATLISVWVYLAISVLGAYVISLYVSSSTLIYFLLRRDVDATEMDEVYLESSDDDLSEAAVTTEAALSPTPVASEPAGQPVDVPAPPAGDAPSTL